MTEQQKRVAEEWVIDYNYQKAGERAGVQGDNIRIIAWKMCQYEDVQDYIEQLQAEAAIRCQVSKDDLLREFKKVGFSNIADFVGDDFSVKRLSELKSTEAIKSVKRTVRETPVSTETSVELTLHDKLSALTSIGRHTGFFSEDNKQRNPSTPLMPLDPLNDIISNDSTSEDSISTETD